jgi:hypothetical protein
MAQRVTTRKVLSDEVQGEGSWVMLRALPYGMVTRRAKITQDDMEQVLAFNQEFLAEVVVDWNWVDDAGAPLPIPAQVDQLVIPEFEFIARAAGLDGQGKKASETP